jgi:DNA modification methylase
MSKQEVMRGDCLEIMKGFAGNSFDCVITDPPFGIDFKGYDSKDVSRTFQGYEEFINSWLPEAMRVAKDGAFFAIWQPAPYFKHLWEWYGEEIHIYAACKNFVQLRKTPINYAFDPVVMFYKEGEKLKPIKPKRNVDFFVSNTASLVSKPDRLERQHPCPRPVDVVREIMENFSTGNILDPFMGSGTTLLAAKQLGRSATGIEISEKYCEIARRRLEQQTLI